MQVEEQNQQLQKKHKRSQSNLDEQGKLERREKRKHRKQNSASEVSQSSDISNLTTPRSENHFTRANELSKSRANAQESYHNMFVTSKDQTEENKKE